MKQAYLLEKFLMRQSKKPMNKYNLLKSKLSSYVSEGIVLAFSGGVDSA